MDHAVRHASSNRRERAFSASPTPARNALSSTPDSAETVMGAGGGREWTPSVRGRPEVLSRASFQQWQDERRQESWDDQWSSWSSWQSQGTSWEDPWSAYLDRRRPSWRRQRAYDMYENWTAEEEDDGDDPPPTPPGSAVPFPRLLSRRENSPVPKEPPPPSRLFPERPELTAPAPGDLRASRLPAQAQEPRGTEVVRPDLRLRPGDQALEPHGTGVVRPDLHLRPGDQAPVRGDVLGQGSLGPDRQVQGSNSYGKDSKQGDTGGSGGFLRLHSSFPPEFKAKPGESWKDYWRSVEFWLASEGANLPASVRGARLMQSMKERAGKIVAHLSVSDVAAEDGVQRIREEMEKSPIIRLLEHKEVDKTRKKFMRLCRHPRESLESFINRASIYRHENDRCQNYRVGTKFYLGHLLDAAKLTNKDEALVKTAAGGLHDENKVVNAMLELAEQLEGKPGYPIGRGEPNLHDDDEYLFQKGRDKDRDEPAARVSKPFMRGGRGRDGKFRSNHKLARKWKQVFHAILEDDEDQGSSEEEPSSVEEKGTSPDEQDETPEREDDGSSGSSELPAEVYAQEYKAKKKVNEIRQMRQFFQKGTNPDKTKAWVREQQKKEPCFLCGRLGHWSQECPDRARSSGRKPHAVNVVAGNFTDDRGQWDLLESMAGYMSVRGESFEVSSSDCFVVLGPRPVCHQSSLLDHESFWAMRELHSSLILDIGCMKSVAGTKWTNQHINRLRGLGRWMKAIKEKESFRFGDGHELCSEFAFIFEATIMGIRVLLRISVVPGDCPPLLSKPACTQLGLVIDTENHTVSSRKLKVSKYGLTQTYGGHYALPIAEFTDDMSPMHDPNLPEHIEAIPVYVTSEPKEVLPPPSSTPASSSSHSLRSWTRHDKGVANTVGPGSRGPPWKQVVHRTVYDTQTGAKILDEVVCESTRVRQPLQCVSDTTTIFMFRVPGSFSNSEIFSMSASPPSSWSPALSNGEASRWERHEDLRDPRTSPRTSSLERGRLGPGLHDRAEGELGRMVGRGGRRGDRTRGSQGTSSTPQVHHQGQLRSADGVQGEIQICGKGQRDTDARATAPTNPLATEILGSTTVPGDGEYLLRSAGNSGLRDFGNNRKFEGAGCRAGGADLATHGPHLDPHRGLESNEGVLDCASGGPRGGVGLLQEWPDGDGGGCGQADREWRNRLGGDRGRGSDQLGASSSTQRATCGRSSELGDAHTEVRPEDDAHQGREGQGADGPCGPVSDIVDEILRRPGGECDDLPPEWKTFVWMIRVRAAVRSEFGEHTKWRRNPRWLMGLFGRQLASLWGHVGAARQLTNDPKHFHLMKGDEPPPPPRTRSRREG